MLNLLVLPNSLDLKLAPGLGRFSRICHFSFFSSSFLVGLAQWWRQTQPGSLTPVSKQTVACA